MTTQNRIAVGGILTECNHFGGLPIDMDAYRASELLRGPEILDATTSVLGGMVQEVQATGDVVRPLLFASACSGGPITMDCYQDLKRELLDRLEETLPVDGVLLPIHGSALVDGLDDPEGDLCRDVRRLVGPDTPVIGTLDLHANVTPAMVRETDALLAWETYPHRDQYQTGQRAVRLLKAMLAGVCRPTMAAAKVPVITSAIHGSTDGEDPFAQLMRATKSLEDRPEVLSSSLFLVHPYMDVAEMGSGAVVVTDNNLPLARELAAEAARQYWQRRNELEPHTKTPNAAIVEGQGVDGGPVILVETADCCGGGAAGDSIATLSALVDARVGQLSIAPIVDPGAAKLCHEVGVGSSLRLELGHRLDQRWGKPRVFEGVVEQLYDGDFVYSGGMWEGHQEKMGPTAVFRIGHVRALIMSRATYDWSDEQLRAVGFDPRKAKFIVAKNPMNYRWAYGSYTPRAIILDTPGPTPATVRHFQFEKLKRPFFPLDVEIEGLEPAVFD